VVDYGKLADKAKALQRAGRPGGEASQTPPADPRELYDKVKIFVLEEVTKANAELGKRGMVLIERVLSPSYTGRLCLSFGTTLLCNVDYTSNPEGACRITAIISGPPNAAEISRREFLAVNESPHREKLERLGTIPWKKGTTPQRIAVEIVSGLLAGEFE
jgi:hypothetical protein